MKTTTYTYNEITYTLVHLPEYDDIQNIKLDNMRGAIMDLSEYKEVQPEPVFEYDVYSGAFSVQEGKNEPIYLGRFKGKNFQVATFKALVFNDWEVEKYYNKENNTFWSVPFFDNKEDATRGYK